MIIDGPVLPVKHSSDDRRYGCACANCMSAHCDDVADQLAARHFHKAPIIESRRVSPHRGTPWFTFTPSGGSLGTK